MIQNNSQNVLAAFDVLIEEIEDALRSIHKAGANALEDHNYDRAQKAIEYARRLIVLREKAAHLKGQWKDVEGTFSGHAEFCSENSTCTVYTATNEHEEYSFKAKSCCSP